MISPDSTSYPILAAIQQHNHLTGVQKTAAYEYGAAVSKFQFKAQQHGGLWGGADREEMWHLKSAVLKTEVALAKAVADRGDGAALILVIDRNVVRAVSWAVEKAKQP